MSNEFVDPNDLDPFDPKTDQVRASQEKTKREADVTFARRVLEARKGSYHRVFVEGTPTPEDRAIVLNDLRAFCRHGESTYNDNERLHVLLTGRQEVSLRIDDFTRLSVDALVVKYTAANQR